MKLLRSSPSQKNQSSFSMITGIGPEPAETCFFNDKSLCTGHGLPPLAFRICGFGVRDTMRFFILITVGLLAACAGPTLPAPNSADVRYDGRDRAVQVMVSSLQPPTAAALIAPDGTRYPASGIALVSGPHVLYNPPPSIGLGIGGFGFSGCCSGFGSGLGIGVPVGGPTPAEMSDQYVASALIPVPPDYASNGAATA
jgi:hypothetical protein